LAPSKTLSDFERLPGEVRNMIYGYSLKANKSIIPRVPEIRITTASRSPRTGLAPGTLLGLALGFNKEISQEVLTYFYGQNKFAISIPYHKAWANRIGRKNAACIRELTIHCEAKSNRAENYLTEMQHSLEKRFRNLRVIEYNCEWYMFNTQVFLQKMTAKHMASSWKYFKRLEMVNVQHFNMADQIKANSPAWELLVKLCNQSKVKVVATSRQKIFLNDRAAVEWDKDQ
ncbi:hypothetical protein B0T21DRAFT_252788, partial [Apiosordaria backusii]